MKTIEVKTPKAGLFALVLTTVVGGPIIGSGIIFLSQILSELLAVFLLRSSRSNPAASVPLLTLLFSLSMLYIIGDVVFVGVARLSRIQNPRLVEVCGALFGASVYISYLIFNSAFLPGAIGKLNASDWWIHILMAGPLIGMLVISSMRQAQEPICEKCRRWYDAAQYIGNIPHQRRDEFIQFLDHGQIYEAGNLVVEEDEAVPPNLEIYRQSCSVCQASDSAITIKETFLDARGMVGRKVLRKGFLSFAQAEDLGRRVAKAGDYASR
jgi:hypothetical protein